MKRHFVLLAALLALTAFSAFTKAPEQIAQPGVGKLAVYRPKGDVTSVALFLSGAGGWGASEAAVTVALSDANTLVVGLDTRALEASAGPGSSCAYVAGSLQEIARSAEKQLKLPTYIEPMLVGFGQGAAYAYSAIAEAPQNSFKGGVGIAYDPQAATRRPLCPGAGALQARATPGGGYAVGAAQSLSAPFTVLQGAGDAVNSPKAVAAFFNGLDGSRVVTVNKTGRGFTDPALFKDQLTSAYWQIAGTDSAFKDVADVKGLPDMPVTELRDAAAPEGDTLAIFYSGDGGWADFDAKVSAGLMRQGIPVVGVSSLKYFWQAHTPEGLGADLGTLAAHYLSAWHKKRFIVVGYSFGADIAPFAANRLDPGVRKALRSVALIGSSHAATFEFHISEWLSDSGGGSPTKPEVDRLSPIPVVCIYGEQEKDSLCPDLKGQGVVKAPLSGGHHLDGAFETVAAKIAGVPEG